MLLFSGIIGEVTNFLFSIELKFWISMHISSLFSLNCATVEFKPEKSQVKNRKVSKHELIFLTLSFSIDATISFDQLRFYSFTVPV